MEPDESKKNYEILKRIETRLEEDSSFTHILGSMCTPPSELSKIIAKKYSDINLGDPGLFSGSVKLEKEVLERIATILHAPNTWYGTITSGGSEGNIIGCWAARNWGREELNVRNGKILIPKSAHISFKKAIDLLNLDVEWVDLTRSFRMDLVDLEEKIDKRTIGIVGIAGTTGTGVCDDIEKINDIAQDNNLYLHIDAAHGGMIFPFMKKNQKFAFRNKSVSSVSVDTHKILGGLIPCGSIIFRSSEFSKYIGKKIHYLSGGSTKQFTITGTRPGAPVIATWAILNELGMSYIKKRVNKSIEATKHLINKLKGIDVQLAFKPTINIVGIQSNHLNASDLVKELRKLNWQLSLYSNWARIVVMPHVTKNVINMFIDDLSLVLKKSKNKHLNGD